MMQVLEIHNLRGGYIPELDILQGIDLVLNEGDVVGVLGLNGSGKSTLGKAVMNMIPRREGEIRFCGFIPIPSLCRSYYYNTQNTVCKEVFDILFKHFLKFNKKIF